MSYEVIRAFELKGKGVQKVQMPAGAAIASLGVEDGAVMLYAYCNPAAKLIERQFLVLGNDEGLPEEPRHYVGSFYIPAIGGQHYSRRAFTGHVFTDRKEYPL
jgi:hypothetical protein